MHPLEPRIAALEKQTRALKAYAAVATAALLFTVYGFKTDQTQDSVRTKQLQIVDDQGVPLVTMEKSREGGGSIVLRDAAGERRAWMTVDRNAAQLGLDSGLPESPSAAVGLDVAPNHAHFGVLGERASVALSVDQEKPKMEILDQEAKTVLRVPWRPAH